MSGTRMATRALVVGAAGFGATKVMSLATTAFYRWQSERSKQREREASYGVAYAVAAKKTASLVGVDLSEQAANRAGTAMHYGLGVGWAPAYLLLRRAGVSPLPAGLGTGLSLAVVVDELANPVLGFTPPPWAYPAATHVRALAGHLVYGLTLAALVEAGAKLARR